VHERQCTKVDPTADPAVAGLLGCGVMAGTGAAINTGKVNRDDTVAVTGCGQGGPGEGEFLIQRPDVGVGGIVGAERWIGGSADLFGEDLPDPDLLPGAGHAGVAVGVVDVGDVPAHEVNVANELSPGEP
jgi:hypothetical protein